MSMGMGWGSLQGRKKGPGTLCLETQEREEKGVCKLARDSQGEPRLLAPSHSHSFHKASQDSESEARRRGSPLS